MDSVVGEVGDSEKCSISSFCQIRARSSIQECNFVYARGRAANSITLDRLILPTSKRGNNPLRFLFEGGATSKGWKKGGKEGGERTHSCGLHLSLLLFLFSARNLTMCDSLGSSRSDAVSDHSTCNTVDQTGCD